MIHGVCNALLNALLAQPVASPETAASTTEASPTLLDYIRSGGFLGWVLICLSIVALALIILSFIKQRLDAWAPGDDIDALTRLIRDNDLEGARRYCADPDHESFLTAVIGLALNRCARSPVGFLELRPALEEAGQIEADRRYRLNDGLQLIAALGPMLGLLGTVIALIIAFSSLSKFEGAARSRELADAMSLALVNTAEGLAVAIPCTAFYFYFKRRVDRLATEVGIIVENVVAPLEGRGPGDKGSPRPANARPPSAPLRPPPQTPLPISSGISPADRTPEPRA